MIDHAGLSRTIALLFWICTMMPPSVLAQKVTELTRRMATGQCYFVEVQVCNFVEECKGISEKEFFKWQVCQQNCEKEAEVQRKYNHFVRACANTKAASDQKRSAPPPSAAVPPGQSNDFASRNAAQAKKAAEAPAKNAASKVQMQQEETASVNKRDEELKALQKETAEKNAAQSDYEKRLRDSKERNKRDADELAEQRRELDELQRQQAANKSRVRRQLQSECLYKLDRSIPGCEDQPIECTSVPNTYCWH